MIPIVGIWFATASVSVSSQCDETRILAGRKAIEIADYQSSATPPPTAVVAQIEANLADLLAQCSRSHRHMMDSSVGDLLEASVYAERSATTYLHLEERKQACEMLHRSAELSTAARKLAATDEDKHRIFVDRAHEVYVQKLISAECARPPH